MSQKVVDFCLFFLENGYFFAHFQALYTRYWFIIYWFCCKTRLYLQL